MQLHPVAERFGGKVALVTGAASGIGRAAALRLGSEGAQVVCVDLEAPEEVAAEVLAVGGTATAVSADVSDPAACEAAVRAATESYGKLDVLANVAGVLRSRHTLETTDEDWRLMLDVNLGGPFFLSRAALPLLLERKGTIVNVASTAGMMGQAYLAAYSASKHGVVGLTRSMALEYARQGLRVNAVCPGGVDTAMTRNISFPEGIDFDLIMRASLTPEPQPPESVAAAIAWIASDEAAYVNGAVLAIDLGVTAG